MRIRFSKAFTAMVTMPGGEQQAFHSAVGQREDIDVVSQHEGLFQVKFAGTEERFSLAEDQFTQLSFT